MNQKTVLKSALSTALFVAAASSHAAPTVLDFSELQHIGIKAVNSISEEGYAVSNNCASKACFRGGKDSLRTDIGGSWTTLKRTDGGVFDLLSIELDDLYNGSLGRAYSDYQIDFSFKYASGKEGTKTVNLDRANGLESVLLNESHLRSASWRSSAYLRFDNIQTNPVPEPATWALLPLALGGAFLASRKGKRAAQ